MPFYPAVVMIQEIRGQVIWGHDRTDFLYQAECSVTPFLIGPELLTPSKTFRWKRQPRLQIYTYDPGGDQRADGQSGKIAREPAKSVGSNLSLA